MNLSFQKAKQLFDQSLLNDLAKSDDGFRFLLLRSMSRKELLKNLAKECGLEHDMPVQNLLQKIYNSRCSSKKIIQFIDSVYQTGRNSRLESENKLIHELYQIKEFDWGGIHQNNLEKNIVDNYVKKISEYSMICRAVEEKLFPSLRAYTLCSWYNHWSSMIIEDIFCDHPVVIPAIGKIKQVDFFIGYTPYDLKVTRFPEEYIKKERKQQNLQSELTLLKKMCSECSLPIQRELSESGMLEDLWKKVADQPTESAQSLIQELRNFRIGLLKETEKNPERLINWYYENQGERRFDASNRLFLILVNSNDFFNSWQLKRANNLIKATVASALEKIKKRGGNEVTFSWKDKTYTSLAEVIFVIK